MKNFKDLVVWQKAHQMALEVYVHSRNFPQEERFGLTSQLRRAATSIALNIAEGCGRKTDKDFAHFLQIAFGSANEVEYALLLSKDLGYIEKNTYSSMNDALEEIKRMLAALIIKINNDKNS